MCIPNVYFLTDNTLYYLYKPDTYYIYYLYIPYLPIPCSLYIFIQYLSTELKLDEYTERFKAICREKYPYIIQNCLDPFATATTPEMGGSESTGNVRVPTPEIKDTV